MAAAEIVPEDTDNLIKSRLKNLTWRIEKGDYDMSHVRWDYEKPFTYDGSERRIVLRGLPEGVLPSYRGNSATDAGSYKAAVSFTVSDSHNFNTPEPMELDWEIRKADYDMSGAFWDYNGEFMYNGRMHEVSLRGLPEGVRPVYSGNAAVDTGSYEAVADLIPYDAGNYNKPAIGNCNWQIVKADYDMSAVRWDYDGAVPFNGREQSVMLEQLPNGVTASYTGNEARNAGTYTARAVLTVSDPANYNTPAVGDCIWAIMKADHDMSGIRWNYDEGSLVYDGERIVAMARAIGDKGLCYYIKDVVVLPEYQGKGIGRMLINELLSFINENGVPETNIFVELCAMPDKIPFYEKFGFSANEAQRLRIMYQVHG